MITYIANLMQGGDPGTSPILSRFLMSSGEMHPLACQFHASSGGITELGGDSGSEGVILVASQGESWALLNLSQVQPGAHCRVGLC